MIELRRTPTGSETPNAREPSVRQEEPLAIKDQEVASNEEMGFESPEEMDVPLPPLAADVPVEGTDEEMYETERQLTEDRRRKLQERHI